MTADEIAAARGRKILFLYPHSVLNDELLIEILSNEYEIYCLRDHEAARSVARAWQGSIFFVNIDDAMKEAQWEAWIRDLTSQPLTASTRLGIVTYNPNPELAKKYLMDLGIPCGFIQLKLGLAEGKRIILKTLEANEARGRRRFVRARCADPARSTFNVTLNGSLVTGSIVDISIAGMAFIFNHPVPGLKSSSPMSDVQLRLKGTLCRISGKYVGEVKGEQGSELMMFDASLPHETTMKIHRFIYQALQEELAGFLEHHPS